MRERGNAVVMASRGCTPAGPSREGDAQAFAAAGIRWRGVRAQLAMGRVRADPAAPDGQALKAGVSPS